MPKALDKALLKELITEFYCTQRKNQKEVISALSTVGINLSRPTLRNYIKEFDLDNPNIRLTQDEKDRIEEMYCKNGYVVAVISNKLNIPEGLVKDYISDRGLKRNSYSRFSSHELELDQVEALYHLQEELYSIHKDNPYIINLLNTCDMNILLTTARAFIKELTPDQIKSKDISKVNKFLSYRYNGLKESLITKINEALYPIFKQYNAYEIVVPYPKFVGRVYYIEDELGNRREIWGRSLNNKTNGMDINFHKNGDLGFINTCDSIDQYIYDHYPELFNTSLYEIDNRHYNIDLYTNGAISLNDICIIWDYFKDCNLVDDNNLILDDDEKFLFDSYINFECVNIVIDGKLRSYKNYDRLNIVPCIKEKEMSISKNLKHSLKILGFNSELSNIVNEYRNEINNGGSGEGSIGMMAGYLIAKKKYG